METWDALWQITVLLWGLLVALLKLTLSWALAIIWVAWWLWGADWRKLWPTLAQGAWAPVVLLGLIVTLVWASLVPGPLSLGGWDVPSVWWQLGAVVLVLGSAAFCGWLQMLYAWQPQEISLEAPSAAHGDTHHQDDPRHGHGSH